ncbi:MAG TPA: NifB/NifX family molybdenum-iron cluster-binding protein [Deferrisomatales bacterium]|nr:NifB/NifX family molybdenum-iron cluster-binding protein [Deferrisomatales bacterium]
MRIAFVSTDGKTVDEHFGRANRFLVFDRTETGLEPVAERPVSPLSTGDPAHTFDAGRFASIAEALEDCQRIYCTRIGERPAGELAARGIEAVVYEGAITQVPQ